MQVVIGLTPEGLNACFDTATQGDDAITLKPLMLLFQNIVELQEHGPPQHVWEDLRTAAEMVFRCDTYVLLAMSLSPDKYDFLASFLGCLSRKDVGC